MVNLTTRTNLPAHNPIVIHSARSMLSRRIMYTYVQYVPRDERHERLHQNAVIIPERTRNGIKRVNKCFCFSWINLKKYSFSVIFYFIFSKKRKIQRKTRFFSWVFVIKMNIITIFNSFSRKSRRKDEIDEKIFHFTRERQSRVCFVSSS